MLGHLDLTTLELIVKHPEPFNKGVFQGRAAGLQSILMQSIRYGTYYGTDFVFLSDGAKGIALKIPELPSESQPLNESGRANMYINWLFFDGSQEPGIRLLMAYALWKEGDDLKDTIDPMWEWEAAKAKKGKGKGKMRAQ